MEMVQCDVAECHFARREGRAMGLIPLPSRGAVVLGRPVRVSDDGSATRTCN
jgi:hypothetical protein